MSFDAFTVRAKRLPTTWSLTKHACRHCGGRVLHAEGAFMCATCESFCVDDPAGICGCGMLPGARRGNQKRGPLRCIPNPARGPASMAKVVVQFGPEPDPDDGVTP